MNVSAIHGSASVEIASLSYDSRRVLPGDLYFALQRDHSENRSDIELAMERGAAAIVCRPLGNLRLRVPRIEVVDPKLALAEAAAVFHANPGEKLHVIAVTGGLNTWKTAHLTRQLLNAAGIKTGLISSLWNEVGDRTLPPTPFVEASDIQKFFAAMVRAGCTACVLELPSISPAALKGIPINVLIFAGGEQNLRALSLFAQSRAQTPICGIVSCDDETGRTVALSAAFKMHLTYGFSDRAEVHASNLSFSHTGTRFDLEFAGCIAACELPLVGKENVRHLLGAAAASLSTLTPKQVLAAMAHLRTPPASLEPIPNQHGLSIFVDEARDIESLSAIIESVRLLRCGRALLAFGSSQGTTGKARFDFGRLAGGIASHAILTSDNPGTEDMNEICSALAQGLEQAHRCSYHIQPDREQAIRELISMAEPGDVALILGKGERTHQIIGNTIVPFNDRDVASACLETMVAPAVRTNRSTALSLAAA